MLLSALLRCFPRGPNEQVETLALNTLWAEIITAMLLVCEAFESSFPTSSFTEVGPEQFRCCLRLLAGALWMAWEAVIFQAFCALTPCVLCALFSLSLCLSGSLHSRVSPGQTAVLSLLLTFYIKFSCKNQELEAREMMAQWTRVLSRQTWRPELDP